MKKETKNIIYNIPLIFILFFIPLIVFLKRIELSGVLETNWTSATNMDFFSYYKMVWLIIAVSILVIMLLKYLSDGNKIKKTYYYIPLATYALFALLSSFLSEYPFAAVLGFPDRYEGVFVLVIYVFLTAAAINLVNNKKTLKIIIVALLISATILGIHGIFQYFGMDFFQTDFGRHLILPASEHSIVDNLNFEFGERIIYSTMFNPNYVGSYTAMLFSLTMALFILIKEKKKLIMLGAVNWIMFAYWLGSVSRAGMLGGIAAILVISILLHKKIKENWKPLLVLGVGFVIIFTGLNSYGNGNIADDLLSFSDQTQLALEGEELDEDLKNIDTKGKDLVISTTANTINIKLEQSSLRFYDGEGKMINYSFVKQDGEIELMQEEYENYFFEFDNENNLLHWQYGRINAQFKITENGFYIVGHNSQAYKIEEIESWGFEGKERLGSSRGYIWSRTIPLLKDNFFLGDGVDVYAIVFPQNDFVGKLKAFGVANKIVDKPHNMYLQMGVNTGIVSMLAIMSMLAIYIYQSIKIYWKRNYDDFYTKVGVGILAAVIGYAVAGLFNDSVVSVAPVFWILFGIGISINMKLKNDSLQ